MQYGAPPTLAQFGRQYAMTPETSYDIRSPQAMGMGLRYATTRPQNYSHYAKTGEKTLPVQTRPYNALLNAAGPLRRKASRKANRKISRKANRKSSRKTYRK